MDLQNEQDEYIHNAIIPPPQNMEMDTRYTRIIFDSKDRDTSLYPEPNRYEVRFDDDIDDVVSAQLVSVDAPLSSYMINKYFNTFTLTISGTSYDVMLDQGDYEPAAFAAMVRAKMDAINNSFEVEYVTATDNFIFKGSVAFSISFPQANSLHQVFGFKKAEYVSSATGSAPYPFIVRSEYRRNFGFNNYMVMNIESFDVNKSNGNVLHRTFAVITKNYWDINFSDDPKIIKTFTPPIPRLARVKVTFVDRFGNPYDFQNYDHRIELLFASYKQKRKYQNIFTTNR